MGRVCLGAGSGTWRAKRSRCAIGSPANGRKVSPMGVPKGARAVWGDLEWGRKGNRLSYSTGRSGKSEGQVRGGAFPRAGLAWPRDLGVDCWLIQCLYCTSADGRAVFRRGAGIDVCAGAQPAAAGLRARRGAAAEAEAPHAEEPRLRAGLSLQAAAAAARAGGRACPPGRTVGCAAGRGSSPGS